jgi:uncharacterized protein (DUF305 family)
MKRSFFHPYSKPLSMVLSAIALAGVLSACGTVAHTPTLSDSEKVTTSSRPDERESVNPSTAMNHSSMGLGPADADYDLRFIDAMIPHHEGAIVMAKDVLQKSQKPELTQLATDIIKAQNQEIAQMKEWRRSWYPKASDTPMAWDDSMKHMMAMSPEDMNSMRMNMDLGKAGDGYELRFTQAMIPHHEAAVAMAEDVLQKSKRPELLKLAQNIITSQQKEIDLMKQWRKNGNGQ